MNVLIYDKFPVIREGLSLIIKNKIKNSQIFFAGSIDDLFVLSVKEKFDLVLVDIAFDGIDDFFMISKFISMFSFESRLIFLSENCSEKFSMKCKSQNIFAIKKNCSKEEISEKIDECLMNRITNQSVLNAINGGINSIGFENKTKNLSTRELQCAIMMLQGSTNVEIAYKLSLSVTTVCTYKKRVLNKTKTKNIVEFIKFFY